MTGRLSKRLRGIPRTAEEVNRALQLLGTMRDLGWQTSIRHRAALSGRQRPLPWLTYGAIAWLDAVVDHELSVVEFGGGSSTLWLLSRGVILTTIEHDPVWIERLGGRGQRHTLIEASAPARPAPTAVNDAYARMIERRAEKSVDLVLIDGLNRNACVRASISRLASDGALVLDDAERPQYEQSRLVLEEEGFVRLDFVGLSPGRATLKATSVFTRTPSRWWIGASEPVTVPGGVP